MVPCKGVNSQHKGLKLHIVFSSQLSGQSWDRLAMTSFYFLNECQQTDSFVSFFASV